MQETTKILLDQLVKLNAQPENTIIEWALKGLASKSIQLTEAYSGTKALTFMVSYTMHADGGDEVVEGHGRFRSEEEAQRYLPMFKAHLKACGGYEAGASVSICTVDELAGWQQEVAAANAERKAAWQELHGEGA